MSWINNYIAYKRTAAAGLCPDCGSAKISVKELKTGRGSVTFTCENCNSYGHFDESRQIGETAKKDITFNQ